MKVKAITIHQPWADLIAKGYKRLETRSWWRRYRGSILIHASQTECVPDFFLPVGFPHWGEFFTGSVIAIARIAGITWIYQDWVGRQARKNAPEP